jgi:hypothetical protein
MADDAKKFARLRAMNIGAACLHFFSGVLMVVLSSDLKVPVMTSFLKMDAIKQTLVPDPKVWFEIPLGPLVASFLFLSALAHLLISLPKINDWYNKGLANHINKMRWIEYAFSSSLMIVVISTLVGITDIAALVPIFFVNAMMILFGWMMELHNQTTKKVDWTSYIFGCIAGVAPWIVIAIYLASPGSVSNPPTFVYWIFFSIFLFFNIFAINQVLQYKKTGKWADYLYGEKTYIVLSFVAKSLLAWQVFAGTLRP